MIVEIKPNTAILLLVIEHCINIFRYFNPFVSKSQFFYIKWLFYPKQRTGASTIPDPQGLSLGRQAARDHWHSLLLMGSKHGGAPVPGGALNMD